MEGDLEAVVVLEVFGVVVFVVLRRAVGPCPAPYFPTANGANTSRSNVIEHLVVVVVVVVGGVFVVLVVGVI